MMRPCFSAPAINLPSFLLTLTDHSSISDPQIPLIRVSELWKNTNRRCFTQKWIGQDKRTLTLQSAGIYFLAEYFPIQNLKINSSTNFKALKL